jgi:3-oxo-5-alpha-steroid 4-dehydrogenase 3
MLLFGVEVHLVWTILTVFSLAMVILGGMVNYFETFLPTFLGEAFRYGKTSRGPTTHTLLRLVQVPKSYFLHFYVFAIVYVTTLWVIVCTVYLLQIPAPSWMVHFLDFCGTTRDGIHQFY